MIGNLYVSQYDGLKIQVWAINLRKEEVLGTICHYIPSMEEYEECPRTNSLTLYRIKMPEEKEPINCYFSTHDMETAVQEIRYFEDCHDR